MIRGKGATVVTVRSDASVSELLTLLQEHHIGAVVVSDDDERVDGIVSERDIVRHLASDGVAVVQGPVSAIMTTEVHTCGPGDSIESLESTMTERRFRHVPVVEESRLVGIVSIGDVVKNRIESLRAETEHLRDYIQH